MENMKLSFRWYGTDDKVTLKNIRQMESDSDLTLPGCSCRNDVVRMAKNMLAGDDSFEIQVLPTWRPDRALLAGRWILQTIFMQQCEERRFPRRKN